MKQNIHIVAIFFIIYVWNSQSQEKEEIIFTRDYFKMFWIIEIIQGFVVSFLNLLNWELICCMMVLYFLCLQVK